MKRLGCVASAVMPRSLARPGLRHSDGRRVSTRSAKNLHKEHAGKHSQHGQRRTGAEVSPEADRDAARARCTTIRLATEPRVVRLPAMVEAIATTSQARAGSASRATN